MVVCPDPDSAWVLRIWIISHGKVHTSKYKLDLKSMAYFTEWDDRQIKYILAKSPMNQSHPYFAWYWNITRRYINPPPEPQEPPQEHRSTVGVFRQMVPREFDDGNSLGFDVQQTTANPYAYQWAGNRPYVS